MQAEKLDTDLCPGAFNFMNAAAESSLFRNGRIMIQRDALGDTSESRGIDLEAHTLNVRNARSMDPDHAPTCDRNGFELRYAPLVAPSIDFTDHNEVVNTYYPECEALVAQMTSARAFAFDHNIRSASGQASKTQIAGGQRVQGPAHVVHGDYTLRSAPERLSQLAQPPAGNDTLLGALPPGESLISQQDLQRAAADSGRFAIINVWRNIADEPVVMHPMALCDSQTVTAEDLLVFEIHYDNRIGENYFSKFSPGHRMYYYPAMTPEEALLIKQWDSAGPLARSGGRVGDGEDPHAPCTFSFHSAFDDPNIPDDAPERWSIEVRCLVLYD